MIHERVVVMTVATEDVPFVPERERVDVERLGKGFFRVKARYGFMEEPNVPAALEGCRRHGLAIDPMATSYFLGSETLLASPKPELKPVEEQIFIAISATALSATIYFSLPPDRVVESAPRSRSEPPLRPSLVVAAVVAALVGFAGTLAIAMSACGRLRTRPRYPHGPAPLGSVRCGGETGDGRCRKAGGAGARRGGRRGPRRRCAGCRRCAAASPSTRCWTRTQVELIHDTAMRLLETIGIEFRETEALATWREAGAEVQDQRVRIPRDLLMELVAKAPERFTVHARNPERSVEVGGDAHGVRPDLRLAVRARLRRRAPLRHARAICRTSTSWPTWRPPSRTPAR